MIATILKGFLGAIIGLLVSLGFLFLTFNVLVGPERGATNHGAAALAAILFFAGAGLIIGAILIFLPWHINRWLLLLLLILLVSINLYGYIERLPQVETLGNFELQTYSDESYGDTYGFRYQGKRFDVEEQAGKEGRNRRVNSVVVITPTTTISTLPLFLAIIGPPHDTRSFYLVGEKDGAAFAQYLCDTNADAVDALDYLPDNLPTTDRAGLLEARSIYLHRKEMTGSGWLLLGDACVLDLQTATPYPFTSIQAIDSADLMLDRDHLPVALAPDRHSLVRIAMRHEYDAKTGDHLGHSLHLLVNNFVDDTSYAIAIDRQRMRYNRYPTSSFWVDDIDQRWLDHHFVWQKGEDGNDRLVERSSFAPWAYLGWVSGSGNHLEYKLTSVKPELLDQLEEFLVAQFGAKRMTREHSAEYSAVRTTLTLQIEDKELTVTFSSDGDSPTDISFWQSEPDPLNGEWLKKIALAVNQQLQRGDYDDYFVFNPYS